MTSFEPVLDVQAALARAIEQHRSGNLAEAERHYRSVLSVDRENFDALHLLGICAHQGGKHLEAQELISRALRIRPESPAAHANLGLIQQALGQDHNALASFERALAVKPDNPDVLANRGSVLLTLNCVDEALSSCDRALEIEPNHVEALLNRASALLAQNQPDEALGSLDQALAIRPDYYKGLNNRGNVLLELNRPSEALTYFERMLTIHPVDPEAHLNRAFARLTLGDYEGGWAEYEWRWFVDGSHKHSNFGKLWWTGKDDLAGKTVLVHHEQGLGDTIQFCRYAPLLSKFGAKVLLVAQAPLRTLLDSLDGVDVVLEDGNTLPEFDYHSPLLSLPYALGGVVKTIPSDVPYLSASADRLEAWGARLGEKKEPRVGIAWSGNPENPHDRNRSLPVSFLGPLLARGIQFVSLQNEVRAHDQGFLEEHREFVHFGAEIKDFADTAALASLMDLVISVDTAIAHLAGALGRPLWAVLPYAPGWRWPYDREDSPWYPTARQFRQPKPGDWGSVIQQLNGALRNHFPGA